jgi:hypothetical protein
VYVYQYKVVDKVFADPDAPSMLGLSLPTVTEFIAEWKADLKQQITALRYDAETADVTVDGRVISGSRDSRAMISQTLGMLTTGVVGPKIPFKGVSGWFSVDQEKLTNISSALAIQVQAAFALEEAKHAQIIGLPNTIKALDGYVISFTL